jgi:hypothetical protein
VVVGVYFLVKSEQTDVSRGIYAQQTTLCCMVYVNNETHLAKSITVSI